MNPYLELVKHSRYFYNKLTWRFALIFILAIFSVVAESFGFLVLLPFLESLDSRLQSKEILEEPTLGFAGSNFLPLDDGSFSLEVLLLLITGAFVTKGILGFGAIAYGVMLRGVLLRELRMKIFDGYCEMTHGYFLSKDSGHFINIINAQVSGWVGAFTNLVACGVQLVSLFVYISVALLVAYEFGLFAIAYGCLLFVVFKWSSAYVRDLSRKASSENGRFTQHMVQILHAFKYLAATAQMLPLRHSVDESVERITKYQVGAGLTKGLTDSLREPLSVIAVLSIVAFQVLYLDSTLQPILVAILLFYRALNTVMLFQSSFQAFLGGIGSIESVESELEALAMNREMRGDIRLLGFTKQIVLENVTVRYPDQQSVAIDRVSLSIPAKSMVAFIGESGAGKSTLADVITGRLIPNEGVVSIDDKPLCDIDMQSWRNQIGYVSQETIVFDDTIENNISMWGQHADDDQALTERVIRAAKQSFLHDYIINLPQGYKTLVGERGMRLSGGQRQRLFIARELFRSPNLLILDEATSALDSESEKIIQKNIDSLKGQISVIAIAHRLSTIKNADIIFVLSQGRVVEEGSFIELTADPNSRLNRLLRLQSLINDTSKI